MKRVISLFLIMVGFVVIGLLSWTMPAESQDTPGVWKQTGSMATSRRHSAHGRLPDGRILVVGGTDTTGVDGVASIFYATAEIYNPATGNWTATGSLTTGGRALFTVAQLPGEKILFAGGWNGSAALSSAETYDPGTGTFSATGSMTTARAEHRSMTLFDGRVLITGGFDSGGTPLASAEICDPATGTFSATAGPMAAARSGHRMNTVGEGKVLVTGGFGAGGVALASAELFDPATGTFSPADSLGHARAHHSATVLPTGEVLVTGGHGGTSNTANNLLSGAEIYDPATGTFTWTTGNLINVRRSHQAILLYTGKVLITGGNGGEGVLLDSAELYDPVMDTFTATGNMITARSPTLTRLPNGKILVSGGSDATGTPIQTLEIYDPATGTFTAAGNGLVARDGGRVSRLANGKMILVGGQTTVAETSVTNSAELYNHVTGTFSTTESLITGKRNFAQVVLPNGRVLVAGGLAADGTVLASAELYTPLIADEVDTTITSGPGAVTDSTSATFIFTSTAAGSTFECSLDNGAFAPCTSPKSYSPLAVGSHHFQVHATDSLGNTDPTPAIYDWTIMTLADTMITEGPAAATNSTSAEFRFTSTAAGSTFECSLDNTAFAPCTNPKSYTKLKVKNHNFKVRASAGGYTDPTPASFDWTIDKKAPNTKITSSPSKLTNNNPATFSFTSTEGDSTFECSLDGGVFALCVSPWTSAPLSDGKHAFQVRAIDPAGNPDKSAAKAKAWTVDTTPPDTTIIPPKTTTSTTAKFKFKSTEKKCTFECNLDDAGFTSCKSSQSYTGLSVGEHNLKVRATDAAGNIDLTPASTDWTID